jgi:putative ABC transport system permease protein
MLDIAYKNMKARKLRTVLSVVAIVAAVMLFVVMNTLVDANKELFEGSTTIYKGKIVVLEHGKGNLGPMDPIVGIDSEISLEQWEEIYSSIESKIARCEKAYVEVIEKLPGGYGPQFYIMGVTTHDPSFFFSREFEIEKGNFDGALVGSAAAEYFKITEEDISTTKEITTRDGERYKFKVGGLLQITKNTWNIDFAIILPLENVQKLFDEPETMSYILIEPKGSDEELSTTIESQWNVDALTTKDFETKIDQMVGEMNVFMDAISTVAVFIAVIMIMTVFFMVVRERTKEIATLKACGARNRWIISLTVLESLIISFLGGGIGAVASYFLVWGWFGGAYMELSPMIGGFLLGLIVGPLASLIPAVQASRMDPVEGLSYE